MIRNANVGLSESAIDHLNHQLSRVNERPVKCTAQDLTRDALGVYREVVDQIANGACIVAIAPDGREVQLIPWEMRRAPTGAQQDVLEKRK